MKKGLVIGILAIVLLVSVGCSKKDPIVGKWAYGSSEAFMFTFNEDKTCHYTANNKDCTYTIDGDKLSITYDGDTAAFDTTFKIEDNKLTIIDSLGNEVVYEKR